MDLKKYDDAAEARNNKPVVEYHEYLAAAGHPQKLFAAVPSVEKLLAINQKVAARIAKDFPLSGNKNRPPWLADRVSKLHLNLRALSDRFASLPQRLKERAERIRAAKPPDFRLYAPETLAKLDINQCDSLMSEVLWLERFPETIATQELEIVEWLNSPHGGRQGSTPIPAPAFAPAPSRVDPDEGKVISDWDPRK